MFNEVVYEEYRKGFVERMIMNSSMPVLVLNSTGSCEYHNLEFKRVLFTPKGNIFTRFPSRDLGNIYAGFSSLMLEQQNKVKLNDIAMMDSDQIFTVSMILSKIPQTQKVIMTISSCKRVN